MSQPGSLLCLLSVISSLCFSKKNFHHLAQFFILISPEIPSFLQTSPHGPRVWAERNSKSGRPPPLSLTACPAGEFLKQLRAAQSLSSKMYSCMILTLRVGQRILAVDLICMCYFVKWERRWRRCKLSLEFSVDIIIGSMWNMLRLFRVVFACLLSWSVLKNGMCVRLSWGCM